MDIASENSVAVLPKGAQIKHPIVFTGNGTEYAKIYFVNLALTILTLGIYSAWAKVRNKRYFYGNTLLDQSSFEYHASPIQILKGRLLVVGLFILYNILGGAVPALAGVLFLLLFAALPWLILKSTQFNMRNSSYRQIRFDFKGDMGEMFGLYVILPIAAVFTLWLAYPYVAFRQKKYYANHTFFGKSPFVFNGVKKEFFIAYYKAFGSLLLVFIILGILMGSHTKEFVEGFSEGFSEKFKEEFEEKKSQQLHPLQAQILPAYTAESNQTKEIKGATEAKDEKSKGMVMALTIIFIVIFYVLLILIMLVVMTYINTRLTNYLFNNLKLNYMRFSSRIGYGRLMWIYISNTVLIFMTLGLFIPWAKVRAVRYKLSCMEVYAIDLDSYIAAETEQIRAVGEEFSDFLDVDVGL